MSNPLDVMKLEVRFPLADGRVLVQGPLAYNQDGLATRHNADFMRDPRFLEAYRVGMENGKAETQIQWRHTWHSGSRAKQSISRATLSSAACTRAFTPAP